MEMALNTLQEWVLITAIAIHFVGIYKYRKLAKRSGWLRPFILWTAIVILMTVPRILSQLVYEDVLNANEARMYSTYIYFLDSVLVVWSAICFSLHFDKWIERLRVLEEQAASPIVTEVIQDADV